MVAPRAIVAPVLKADPPEPVVTPNAIMLSCGETAGAGTTIFVPLAVCPAATVMTLGGARAPLPTGAPFGEAAGLGEEEELLPPQPETIITADIT